MKIEHLDIIEANEVFTNGLFALSRLIDTAEMHNEICNVTGLAELIQLLAKSSQKQTQDMQCIFKYLEQ